MKWTTDNRIGDKAGIPKIVTVLLFSILLICPGIKAQNELLVLKSPENGWLSFSDASNSLYHYLAEQSFDLLSERARVVAELQSVSDWQERQNKVRKTLIEIVGPFPAKTPLNARIVKTFDKDGYRVEHIIYESQPGFYVTSSLFIPLLHSKRKAPAVIYCSGHSVEGYRSKVYQHIILNLVKKGFIVFAFDPVGQGERLEYLDPDSGKSALGGPTNEHSYAGAQALIAGSSYARYMIWDGIRAVDYLVSRKEVDPARIGITGRSGGGTQSAYIAAFDDRIYAAAPECYITNFTRLLQSIGPQDAEQNLYKGIANGIDHADLLSVRAPRPAMIISTTRDFFSIQGARESAKEVMRIYKAYGKEENFSMVEDDAPHESTTKNREEMYAFFQKHLINPGSSKDQEISLLSEDELRVTVTGQVSTTYAGETVFSLNRKEAGKIAGELKPSGNDLAGMLNSARMLSGYREPVEAYEPVFTGRIKKAGYAIEKYFVRGESDYVIPYLLMVPDKPNGKGLIYLHPSGKSTDASPGGRIEWFVMNGFTVLAPDLIGVGEIGPGDFHGDSYIDNQSFNLWFASMLIGRSIVGIQAGDVVRLARYLEKCCSPNGVYGFAIRETAPVMLHAAAFDPVISRVALIEPLSSYMSLVMNHHYKSGFIFGTVPGSLYAYDLPDLSASLSPRKLMMIGITDCMGNAILSDSVKNDLYTIRSAYHHKNADEALTIIAGKTNEEEERSLLEWLK
jgi:hypothetical protein